MCHWTLPTYMHTYIHFQYFLMTSALMMCIQFAVCVVRPSPLFCFLHLWHTQIIVVIRIMVSPRHKRVAMISITQSVNPPKQLVASGSPAKEQDWEVRETMLLCVAFAYIKACVLLSAAYLTCAAEDLYFSVDFYSCTPEPTSRSILHKTTDRAWTVSYSRHLYLLIVNLSCYATNTDVRSHAGLYIHCPLTVCAGHLPCGTCFCQLVITSKNYWMTPVNSPCT